MRNAQTYTPSTKWLYYTQALYIHLIDRDHKFESCILDKAVQMGWNYGNKIHNHNILNSSKIANVGESTKNESRVIHHFLHMIWIKGLIMQKLFNPRFCFFILPGSLNYLKLNHRVLALGENDHSTFMTQDTLNNNNGFQFRIP